MPKKSLTTQAAVVTPVIKITPEEFAGQRLAPKVLAQLIVDLQHNQHRSTANTKTRGEVAGSTKKPWRQKGTGRARVGSKRTPLWRGGGQIFGPRSIRNYSHKVNHSLLAPGLRSILISKAASGDVMSLDQPQPSGSLPKTKTALTWLQGVIDPQSNLLIIPEVDPVLQRTTRNLPYLKLRTVAQVNLLDVAAARHIILAPGVLKLINDKLK